jgi:hypothetical protein
VVDEPSRLEIRGEAAAGASRRAVSAQHSHEQHREVATGADDTIIEGASLGEGPSVVSGREPEDLLRGPSVGLAASAVRKFDAIRGRDVLVKQQPLNDARDHRDVAR